MGEYVIDTGDESIHCALRYITISGSKSLAIVLVSLSLG